MSWSTLIAKSSGGTIFEFYNIFLRPILAGPNEQCRNSKKSISPAFGYQRKPKYNFPETYFAWTVSEPCAYFDLSAQLRMEDIAMIWL